MPFEMFVDCFYVERPFFLVSHLDDGRIAVTPNPTVVPLSLFQAGHWPCDLLPDRMGIWDDQEPDLSGYCDCAPSR